MMVKEATASVLPVESLSVRLRRRLELEPQPDAAAESDAEAEDHGRAHHDRPLARASEALALAVVCR